MRLKKIARTRNNESLAILFALPLCVLLELGILFFHAEAQAAECFILLSLPTALLSFSSYLGKLYGLFMKKKQGTETTLFNQIAYDLKQAKLRKKWMYRQLPPSPPMVPPADPLTLKKIKNHEGRSIAAAIVFAAIVVGLMALLRSTTIFPFQIAFFPPLISQLLFSCVFTSNVMGLWSRCFRILDQNVQERAENRWYNRLVLGAALTCVLLGITSLACGLFAPGAFTFLAFLEQAVLFTYLFSTGTSFTVSCCNYAGRIADHVRQKNINNETLAIGAGFLIGIALACIILSCTSGGLGLFPSIGLLALLMSHAGLTAAQIAFTGMVLSVTVGVCARIGRVVNDFCSRETVLHKFGWLKSKAASPIEDLKSVGHVEELAPLLRSGSPSTPIRPSSPPSRRSNRGGHSTQSSYLGENPTSLFRRRQAGDTGNILYCEETDGVPYQQQPQQTSML